MKEVGRIERPLALRYKNITYPEKPYIALYPFPDPDLMSSPEVGKFQEETAESKVLEGNVFELLELGFRPYVKIQTFEGFGHAEKTGNERGQTIVAVAMEPGPSEEQEKDREDWYRKQHLDMLAMCRGYRRTTRYKRLDGVKPRYIALHEYACKPDELPADQIAQVRETEWSKKILAEAEIFDRDVFELIHAQGDTHAKL